MAEVTKQPNGRYRVRWRDQAGERHTPGFTFPTKSAAKRYGDDRDAEVRRGEARDPSSGKILLKDWILRWQEGRIAEHRTLGAEQGTIDLYVLKSVGGAKALGDLRLEQIDEFAVQAWVKRLEKLRDAHGNAVLQPSTILRHYRVLSTVLRPAIRARRIPVDPLVNVTLPTVPPGSDFYWELDEIDLIRANLATAKDRALFEVLYGTGGRWGEIAGLHLDQWQALKRRLTISRTVVERQGFRLKDYPKGGSRRDVPLPEHVVTAVAEHLAITPARDCGLDHGKGKKCPGLLFWHAVQRGPRAGEVRPMSRHGWPQEEFAAAVDAAGVREGTVHDLRHSYASQSVMDGVAIRIVQQLLGHASIRTTERYSHLAPSALDHPALAASLTSRAPKIQGADEGQTVTTETA